MVLLIQIISWINVYLMKDFFLHHVGTSLVVVKERRKRTYMKCFLQQLPFGIALPELFDTVRNSRNIYYAHFSDFGLFAWFALPIVRSNAVLNSLEYENFMFLKIEKLLNLSLKVVILYEILCTVCK